MVVAVAVVAPSSGGNILANSGSVCQFSMPGGHRSRVVEATGSLLAAYWCIWGA